MKVTITVLVLVGTALAAPRSGDLSFKNLFKTPLPDAKPIPDGRIVGGQVASAHSIPYQAFLEVYAGRSGWYCGGSLISQTYVLTAGHCGEDATEAYILLGAQDITKDESTQVVLHSTTIIVHERYNSKRILYDIGLIRLAKAVSLNSNINVASLPKLADIGNTYVGETGKVSGWGLTNGKANDISPVLRYTQNPIISNRECNQVYGVVEDYQICMSGSGGHSSCSGDSGGPLTVKGVLVGVVSYGVEDCANGYPSAFTKTTSFLRWIDEHSDLTIS